MIPVYDTTGKAIARLPWHMRHTPDHTIEELLLAIVESVESLADTVVALIDERTFANAVGAHLDQYGALLGVKREGRSDEVYRVVLGARIIEHRSNGTPEELIAFVAGVLGSDDVRLLEVPVGVYLEALVPGMTPGPVNVETAKRAEGIAAAGVPVRVVVAEVGYFGFDGDPGALGFDDGTLAGVWGG